MKVKKLAVVFTVIMMAYALAACGKGSETRQEADSTGQGNLSSEASKENETNQSEETKQKIMMRWSRDICHR